MSFEPIVNKDKIKEHIAYQYQESTVLQEYIGVLLAPFDELEEVFADILNSRIFSNHSTNGLDVWGLLVDQPRDSYDANEIPFLGLDDADINNPVYHLGLGDLNNPSVGGVFRSIEQSLAVIVKLNNEEYQPMLLGKTYKNNFQCGYENIIEAIKAVLKISENGIIHVEEIFTTPTDPYIKITINKTLTGLQKRYLEIMDVLPKPGGIRYTYVYN